MLVLSRKPDEKIFVGDDIILTVLQIRGGNIRIGIEAPREMTIIRDELSKAPAPERASRTAKPRQGQKDRGKTPLGRRVRSDRRSGNV